MGPLTKASEAVVRTPALEETQPDRHGKDLDLEPNAVCTPPGFDWLPLWVKMESRGPTYLLPHQMELSEAVLLGPWAPGEGVVPERWGMAVWPHMARSLPRAPGRELPGEDNENGSEFPTLPDKQTLVTRNAKVRPWGRGRRCRWGWGRTGSQAWRPRARSQTSRSVCDSPKGWRLCAVSSAPEVRQMRAQRGTEEGTA